jgi:penicillin-binding protein 2
VLDAHSGEVLAMASAPSFDPNAFMPFLPAERWTGLTGDPVKPLLNRAAAAVYAPGSVFKPIVALAALDSGRATPGTRLDCPGYFGLGAYRLRCWNPAGHGTLALRKAIEQSCNSYFAALGLQCGYEAILACATNAGLGEKTGIELDREAPGLVPGPQWKRQRYHDGWRAGDTCNVSIGQGAVSVTALQMAVVTAALANGGLIHRPRLVRGFRPPGAPAFVLRPPEPARRAGWSAEALRTVREGMYDVVMADSGTGHRAAVPGLEMAGKTGTAEYGPKPEGRKHGWMLAFAPFVQPRYAAAMVLDDADSGGRAVAPRVRFLIGRIFAEREGRG